ncbi:MAG: phasin [uncultured bacterium]|nr:MAG: phasin [uncultured bacterium]OFW68179.1 MAG: hypothetical protein A2X70_05740 [Alphaproteobacteria bacterium GWC2_42_16]OFW73572.1 MAG: hypothetical protein A2Z80_07040 [Alphaproteobacteria bacterium GWA2_41_27]OFW82421.1 MAG: hypothetical protein A3E50_04440 [Alphaproteobacteria bacterium RIFCSPHIGHO2_12_FULL_42_100]OFW86245.1 MAG: hypothetical protein A2W06_01370 [Alphaproteobacteria bacterium RBG_16_42_14]OFW91805.1 MAG: hypothetical protein A3C41_01410 [Alphaproteobacteria bacteriu
MAKEKNIPPFGEGLFNPFKGMNNPVFDMKTLTANYQQNIELMNSTQKIAVEATQSIMALQNQYLKNIFEQWNKGMKNCLSQIPLEEKMTCQSESTKVMVDKTVEHARDINAIIEKSNEKVVESLQKHFKKGLDESADVTKKMKEES